MFIFKPEIIPAEIILIGAGGTGSRLVPMLAQLVRTCIRKYNPTAWMESLPIYIVDNDIVEEKNLLRQNFIHRDVGQPKASVLASRYSAAFGIPIYSSVSRIGPGTGENPTFLTLNFPNAPVPMLPQSTGLRSSIIIMAVDSAEARRQILLALNKSCGEGNRHFVIDAGNEDDFGQVKFFTYGMAHGYGGAVKEYMKGIPRQCPVSVETNFIPIDLSYYDSLGSSAQELSCADLPQTLAINSMMATLILSVVQNVLYLKPMSYDGIRFGLNGAVSAEMNTPTRWIERMNDADKDPKSYLHNSMNQIRACLGRVLPIYSIENSLERLYDEVSKFCKKNRMEIKDRELVPLPPPVVVPEKIPELKPEPLPESVKKTRKKATTATTAIPTIPEEEWVEIHTN